MLPDPEDFDYKHCLFITEGYACDNIPLEKTSTYFVHIAKDPSKFLRKDCRLIDIRYHTNNQFDFNYAYNVDDQDTVEIDSHTLYEKNADDNALNASMSKGVRGYEAMYMHWATLVPTDFDEAFDYRKSIAQREINWVGTIAEGDHGNANNVAQFVQACRDGWIQFNHYDPWQNPVSEEDLKTLVQRSLIAPDIRSDWHLKIGYIPCRVFKNVMFGHVAATNSDAVYKLFQSDGVPIIYANDCYALFQETSKNDKKDIWEAQIDYVHSKHTYFNRIAAILKVYHDIN